MIGQGPTLSQAGLATGRLGRRLAWSRQAWLDTESAFPYRASGLHHLRQMQPVGTDFIQASLPAQFRVPLCRLHSLMSVCSGGFCSPCSFGFGVCPDCVQERSLWRCGVAAGSLGTCRPGLCQPFVSGGGHAHGASLHSKMRSRRFVGTGGSDGARVCDGHLVGESNQQYRSYSVAGPRGV